jgi:hypothetical protein
MNLSAGSFVILLCRLTQAHLVARTPGTVVICFELASITKALGAPGGLAAPGQSTALGNPECSVAAAVASSCPGGMCWTQLLPWQHPIHVAGTLQLVGGDRRSCYSVSACCGLCCGRWMAAGRRHLHATFLLRCPTHLAKNRTAAFVRHQRLLSSACLVPVEGFYHHGSTYPS